jgi:mannose-1-phosphate guanylyltransferase
VLLDLLGRWHPEFAAALRAIAADRSLLDELWADLPKIALDHAVAEPAADAGRVASVPSTFRWEDIGDFDSLAAMIGDYTEHPSVIGEQELVRAIDASGLVVPASGRVIAVVGLHDVVVVDTPDVLLVTTRARAQDVKKLVEELRESGREELT